MRFGCTLAVLVLLGACGGGEDDGMMRVDETEPMMPGEGMPPDPLEEIAGKAWDELTPSQKGTFMRFRVVPEMGPMFKAFDPERFSRFGCSTCHGSGAARGEFEMPSDIEPLDFGNLPDDEIVGFMQRVVVPEMAELLGRPPFDPQTGEGFGCLGCHARKE